jgi:mannitol-1-phosphate 5-dehydrogenase
MSYEALQIGAGRIGKGLNGSVLSEAGCHVTFADANQGQVDLLKQHREYPVVTVSARGREETVVRDVDAVNIRNKEAFTKAVVNADIVLTAVGANILSAVAPHLAAGLVERVKQRPQDELHTVVVACENITDNTLRLKREVLNHVPAEYRQIIDERVSFPNCVVDRIVPASAGNDASNPLEVTVEDYFQWVIDGNALRGPMPLIPGIEVSLNLEDVLAQKLFTLNMAHAQVAYLGHRGGYEFIHEAVEDEAIQSLVRGSLKEVESVLIQRNPSITQDAQRTYAEKVLKRFSNPYLLDEVTRVAREPKRKLGLSDRLVTPALYAVDHGEVPAHLAAGITGAYTYFDATDTQAQELAVSLREKGIELVMQEVSGISPTSPLGNLVKANFNFDQLKK